MALSRSAIGSPATWSIGAAGDTPDNYPARTISQPRLSTQNGRTVEVVDIICYRQNQAGEFYTQERLVNTRFLEDRRVRAEALDGSQSAPMTVADLKAAHKAAVSLFQSTRTTEMSVDALSAALSD